MSRNFELLQRLEREGEPLAKSAAASAVDVNAVQEAAAPLTAPADARYPGFGRGMQRQIAGLVQRVFLTPGANAPKTVVFCGVDARPDTSSIVLAACEAFFILKRLPVCLVDAYISSPTLQGRFNVSNERGLTTALRLPDPIQSFGHRLPELEVTMIPTGPEVPSWQALLSSEVMTMRLHELAQQFTCVLIEAPPMSVSTVAAALARAADGIVLVIEAGETRRELALKAKQDLVQAGARLLGTILNNRKFPIPERIYSKL